ncbi:hypothetical protein [uncultured Thiohalocapsa sp.]|uniref:hypothetical protein n=1 Tax=uncultured Thiohalocapsa sp. TaxID=768990 RepID=UPI0025EA635F|nr:hypothetical protein [uncultured Thiohalocapsa sp.]
MSRGLAESGKVIRGAARGLPTAVVAAALVVGCAGTDDAALSETLTARTVAGDFNSIAVTDIRCNTSSEACAKSHAVKGDACLKLAIQQPQSASTQDSRMRELLDCAETGYRKALQLQPDRNAPSRSSYHGGLLLSLSERRNRLDEAREQKLDRENEKLLMAAQDARREVPGSALGFLYGASAHVYRATLKPPGRSRCNDLRQAESLLRRSPPPPRELADEQRRIQSLVQQQLRGNACPRIRRI